jgi:hypothetical protein
LSRSGPVERIGRQATDRPLLVCRFGMTVERGKAERFIQTSPAGVGLCQCLRRLSRTNRCLVIVDHRIQQDTSPQRHRKPHSLRPTEQPAWIRQLVTEPEGRVPIVGRISMEDYRVCASSREGSLEATQVAAKLRDDGAELVLYRDDLSEVSSRGLIESMPFRHGKLQRSVDLACVCGSNLEQSLNAWRVTSRCVATNTKCCWTIVGELYPSGSALRGVRRAGCGRSMRARGCGVCILRCSASRWQAFLNICGRQPWQ